MQGKEIAVKKCWNCGDSSQVKILEINGEQRGRWCDFHCYSCGQSWPENITDDIVDNADPEKEAIWLGQHIFQTAYFCLHITGHYRKKADKIVYRSITEEECLERLDRLKDILYKTEYSWGTRRMDQVIVQCNGKLSWGLEELFALSKKAKRPLVRKKVEDIIDYLSYFTDKAMPPESEQ